MINTKFKDDREVSVSIIDDSEIHREWLKAELSGTNIKVVSSDRFARSGVEAIKLHKPNLVLLDFQLEDMTGLEVSRRIKKYDVSIKIFALTAHTESSIIERLINDKNIDAIAIKGSHYFEANFITAITYVSCGGTYLDPTLLRSFRESNTADGLSKLTKREFEVFIQSNSGKSDESIAKDLCIELSHVRNIKSRVSKKVKNDKVDSLILKLMENHNQNILLM